MLSPPEGQGKENAMSRYDDMSPVSRQDKDREAEADLYAADRRDDYAAARARCGTCGECGGHDGMRGYDRIAVGFLLEQRPDRGLWRWHVDPHHLYAQCFQCNPYGDIPRGYEYLDNDQVRAWLATACDCTPCMMDRGEIPIRGRA
jgi:hypothetical protein